MTRLALAVFLGLAPILAGAGEGAIEGDPDYGEYLAQECVTCHSAEPSAEPTGGIPTITGWDPAAFVAVMRSYRGKERENQTMRMIAGRLSDEELGHLAIYFASVVEDAESMEREDQQ